MKEEVKALTLTVVFEASSVNRDESIGGNIQSIKKLRRYDGVYSFFSRAFLRHKIFNALVKKHGWKEAPVTVTSQGAVIQFDVSTASIIDSEELDFFGYMSTISDTVVRKAPVGITKAVSLEKWEGDMAFYANHDLVRRVREKGDQGNPNPFSKEEHLSFYKYSILLDLTKLGKDEVIVNRGRDGKIFGIDMGEIKEGTLYENAEGRIWAEKIANELFKIKVEISEDEKKRRLEKFLDVVINGYSLHSSTEDWSTVPIFATAGLLKLPLVLFDPHVKMNDGEIDVELLKKAAGNSHLIKAWVYPGMFKIGAIEGFESVSTTSELKDGLMEELE